MMNWINKYECKKIQNVGVVLTFICACVPASAAAIETERERERECV